VQLAPFWLAILPLLVITCTATPVKSGFVGFSATISSGCSSTL